MGWPTPDSVLSMAEALPDTGDVERMVMTSRGLYWLGDVGQKLYRLGTDGKPVLVAMTDAFGSTELEASNSAVVWLWGGSLWALSLADGAAPVEIGTNINITGNPLLLDDTNAYFEPAFAASGGLVQIPLAGGAPKKVPIVASDVIAVHDGYAYYRQPDTFISDLAMRAPLTGGAAEQVDNSLGMLYSPHFAFDGKIIYVSTTRLNRLDLAKPNSSTSLLVLPQAPQQGGENALRSMVLDQDRLVYSDWFGTVGWVTTDGSQCANVLVDPERGDTGWLFEIALDSENLYLLVQSPTDRKGRLHRIARSKVGL